MSARAGEWHLLGHGRDPVPGEPAHVDRLAQGYRATADDIERLTGRLRRLGNLDGWVGEAAEKFAEAADDLAADLGGAERRYRELADAVRGWVGPLSRARDESAGALREAEAAADDQRRYSHDPYAGLADPTPDQLAAQQRWAAAGDDADERRAQAQRRLDDALQDLDRAAEEVAGRIADAAEHGRDGFWDDVGGWVRDHAEVLERIATWAGRIALVLAVITVAVLLIVAAPAALLMGALFWGAVVAGGVQLVTHSVLKASDAGDVSWLDIGMDIVGLATAGIGTILTKGLGRFVIGVRPGTAALRGRAAQQAGGTARTAQDALERGVADYTRAGNATRIGDPTNPLRRWGQQYLDDAGRRVTEAGRQAADGVSAGTVTRVSRTEQVRALDAELATDLAELRRLDDMLGASLRREVDALARKGSWAVRADATGLGAQLADSADEGLDWKDPLERSASAAWRLTH